MFDAEDELDVALHPDDVVRVGDLDVPAPEPVDFGETSVPANPAAAFAPPEPPEFGPPAPGSPEALAATMPAPPAGIPTQDPSQQWPPPVPREAPGQIQPGVQGTPASVEDENDIEGALAKVGEARTESDEAERRRYEGELDDRANRLEFAENRRQELEKRVAADLARQQSDAAADKKAQDGIAQTEAALRGFKFKDLWADKTAGQKVATVLGQALLALGAGMMKTPQYAMQILDKQRAEDHQKQMDNLALLKDDYVRARTGMQDAQLARQKIGADIMLARARKDELLAAQFEEASARAKDANSANDAAAYAAKLKKSSAEANLSARTTLRNLHLKDEENALAKRLKESQILANEANARLRDRGLGQGRKAAKGGGGSPTLGDRGDAYSTLLGMIENGKPGPDGKTQPFSTQELNDFARSHGIPPNGKTGTSSLDSALKTTTFRQKANDAHAKAGMVGEKLLFQESEKFSAQHGLRDLQKVQYHLGDLLKKLHDAPHNPHVQANAFEQSVSAARGGAATRTALELAMSHMGLKYSSVEDLKRAIVTKEFSEKQMENLIGAIKVEQAAAQNKGKEAFDAFERWRSTLPPDKAEAAKQDRARLFSGLHGFGGHGATEPKEARDEEKIQRAKAVANDASQSPKARAGAKNYLSMFGEAP